MYLFLDHQIHIIHNSTSNTCEELDQQDENLLTSVILDVKIQFLLPTRISVFRKEI